MVVDFGEKGLQALFFFGNMWKSTYLVFSMNDFVWKNSYPVIVFNLFCSVGLVILYMSNTHIGSFWETIKFLIFSLFALSKLSVTIDGKQFTTDMGDIKVKPFINILLFLIAIM